MSGFVAIVWTVLFLYTALKFFRCVRMVPNRSAYIVERLGKYHQTLGPGFHMLVPFIDRVAFVQDLKEESIEVPPQECFTRDNVKVEVDGIIYLSVISPENASYGVTDYRAAAIQLAQTTTRSVVGTLDLDRTFEERDAINSRVIGVLAEVSRSWGIKVHRYEVKNIVPPASVRDAMERQMAAERDRRALLASAEGQQRAKINESEGRKLELINRSQGEMQRRVNEAEGRAAEILALARATAESLTRLGQALSIPGGVEAANLRLAQQLLGKLGSVAQARTQVLLPLDLSDPEGLLAAVRLPVQDGAAPVGGALPGPGALPLPAVTEAGSTPPRPPSLALPSLAPAVGPLAAPARRTPEPAVTAPVRRPASLIRDLDGPTGPSAPASSAGADAPRDDDTIPPR